VKYVVEFKPKFGYKDLNDRWGDASLEVLMEAENEGEAQGKVRELFGKMFLGEYSPRGIEVLKVSPMVPPTNIVLMGEPSSPVITEETDVMAKALEEALPLEEKPKKRGRKKRPVDVPICEEPA